MAQVVMVSGPSGAGKSTVCEALCERYDRTVHLETDAFFSWIRMGFIDPMRPESDHQNRMVARAAARAATAYVEELFAVFIDGVIGPHLLPIYIDELKPLGVSVHFVLLLPSLEATVARVKPRPAERRLIGAQHSELHRQFAERGAFAGILIDNSALDAQATADRVMDACGRGEALVWSPEGSA